VARIGGRLASTAARITLLSRDVDTRKRACFAIVCARLISFLMFRSSFAVMKANGACRVEGNVSSR
jgi:hypothetical protein